MRELSGEQHTEREGFPDVSAGPEPARNKGWLWHSFAALVVAALGLVVAAAVGLTTDAQTTRDLSAVPDTSVAVSSAPIDGAPIQTGRVPGTNKQTKSQHPALAAFGRREPATTSRSSRSGAIRAAIVQEQAAQRDELLAKTADEISRAAEDASSDARQQQLKAADRASGEAAAQIAAENLRRATAARVAAENKRQAAENQPNNPDSGSSTTSSSGDGGSGSGGSNGSSGSGSGGSGGGEAVLPVPGGVIGAHFGEYGMWSRYHTGLDFRAAYGTPIRAVKSGVVLYAGNSGNWAGNHVAIKHADGKTTMYSHMSSMSARVGQTVQAGQVIGRVGETGRAFGAHLHFELYPAGVKYGDVYKAINPQPWLAANGVTTH
ncbi:MAG TPA: M23 family metallopeptidase [Propionibacteriaceae bacterium]